MRRFFLVDQFMKDAGCSYIQACVAAEENIEGKHTRAQSVREWGGPDKHIEEYFVDYPTVNTVVICDEEGNIY